FEPFFTTKDEGKGTGLGLALAREYLQRSGGTIQLEERPGGGARFRVTLLAAKFEPAADTEAEADRAA
ncbi:MAG TPA: ATP-binding protein, partial [Vulgatibacter sp.]|nr:ATP-binding protein [Vulgatibacter sp.]